MVAVLVEVRRIGLLVALGEAGCLRSELRHLFLPQAELRELVEQGRN